MDFVTWVSDLVHGPLVLDIPLGLRNYENIVTAWIPLLSMIGHPFGSLKITAMERSSLKKISIRNTILNVDFSVRKYFRVDFPCITINLEVTAWSKSFSNDTPLLCFFPNFQGEVGGVYLNTPVCIIFGKMQYFGLKLGI